MADNSHSAGPNMRSGPPRLLWVLPAGVIIVLALMAPVVWAQAAFQVTPGHMVLGSFTAEDPAGNSLNPGTTTLSLQSSEPWQIQVRLIRPFRRISDNLELPIERARQLFADIPAPFFSYQPARFDYGPGDGEWQHLGHNWQVLQMRLEQYLRFEDPPGIYEAAVEFELQDRAGGVLAEAVELSIEFQILPQVEIVLLEPIPLLMIDAPGVPFEGSPYDLLIRANCAWELQACALGDLVEQGGDNRIAISDIFWTVPGGAGWESLTPVPVPASAVPMLVARGDDPLPFTVHELVVPFQLEIHTRRTTVATNYAGEIRFDLRTGVPVQY